MSIINATPLLAAAGGDYQISRSVRLRSSASAYFNRTFVSGNRQIWSWNGWFKRGKLGSQQGLMYVNDGVAGTPRGGFYFNTDDTFIFALNTSGSSFDVNLTTSQVFRDPSAWYMVAVAVDTTQATAANRVKLYINGVQITAFSTATYPSLNANTPFNTTYSYILGSINTSASNFDGYLTEVNFIDGQALTPSSFGETDSITGVWKPKKYAGTYGTNGFYLNFSDNSSNTATTIGKDNSGNGNNWTPNNISVTAGATYDSMLDVPTLWADGGNGRGNYCVLNPLANAPTLNDGNLRTGGTAGDKFAISTVGVSSGKWYAEMTVTTVGTESSVGIAASAFSGAGSYVGATADSYGYYSSGSKYNNLSGSAYGASFTTGDVIGVAFDADAGTLTFYKNNTSQGTAFTGLSGTYFFAMSGRTAGTPNNCSINFGQRPFAYTPPTGFKALNTQNLPDSTVKDGSTAFNAVLYTGAGATQSVTGVNFQPDLIWVKSRSAVTNHILSDTVRGIGSTTYNLFSNLTNAEGASTTNRISSVDTDGFTIDGSSNNLNTSGYTYVAWNWKESPSAGFDIVTYTGTGSARTVSHSLGVAPKMIIVKRRNTAADWCVYHASTGAGNRLLLSQTNASAADATMWNSTAPTSSVFSVGTNVGVNGNTDTYVAYLFAEVAGFSKFGSYTGNGSADGPFVYLGFRPRFLLIKITSTTGSWTIVDTSRDTYNLATQGLYPDLSNVEDTSRTVDILSNGFKFRSSANNISSATFIYAAFAENPFKNSLAR